MKRIVLTGGGTAGHINPAIAIADKIKYEDYATVSDWDHTAVPSKFNYLGKEYNYNWYSDYEGARHFVSWFE